MHAAFITVICVLTCTVDIVVIIILQGLQYCMQKVLETIVLSDQVEYLRENGVEAELVPVFDVEVSPRTFAIIVKRKPT